MSSYFVLLCWRHDTQHDDIQYNDVQQGVERVTYHEILRDGEHQQLVQLIREKHFFDFDKVPYFIEYNAHTSIVCT